MMMSFLSALVGIPTLFGGDELGLSGYDEKTKNVFLKYYSTPKNYIVWDENDKKAYLSALKKCFEKIKGWGK